MSQELFTSGRSAKPLSEPPKEYWIRLYRSHIPAERCHSCGGIADAGAYFQNTPDILLGEPPQNPQRCRCSAGMKVTHAQPGAKLMILEGGAWLADQGFVFLHTFGVPVR
jgi:hypothetical protein